MVIRNHLGLLTAAIPAIVLAASHSAYAADGVITGNVRDAETKSPIPDAVITVTSPAFQDEQIVVTDAGGHYRVPQLPPGEGYTVAANGGAEYKLSSRGGIKLTSGSTLRVNFELVRSCEYIAPLWPTFVKFVPVPVREFTPRPRIGSLVVPSALHGLFPDLFSMPGHLMPPAITRYQKMAYASCLSFQQMGSSIAPAGPKPIFI